jgi:hypothetical protein
MIEVRHLIYSTGIGHRSIDSVIGRGFEEEKRYPVPPSEQGRLLQQARIRAHR